MASSVPIAVGKNCSAPFKIAGVKAMSDTAPKTLMRVEKTVEVSSSVNLFSKRIRNSVRYASVLRRALE